jgi:inorganic phosphate transporter, PiT family
MAWAVVAGALLLAFENGANDNMKGVATLYGSGALGYRAALRLATISTAFGALASTFLAGALVKAFSAKGLVPDAALTPEYLTAVALGASVTVLLATTRSATAYYLSASQTGAIQGARALFGPRRMGLSDEFALG